MCSASRARSTAAADVRGRGRCGRRALAERMPTALPSACPAGERDGQARDKAEHAGNGQADAEPLTELALPREPYFPLPLIPLAGAPPLPLSAARQGCRLLILPISPQRPRWGR